MISNAFIETLLRIENDRWSHTIWSKPMDNRQRSAQVLAAFETVTQLFKAGLVESIENGSLKNNQLSAISRLTQYTLSFECAEDAVVAINNTTNQERKQIVADGKIWAAMVLNYDMLSIGKSKINSFRTMICGH